MLERWNPTVKAFTVLVCVILLSFEYLVSLNLLVLAVCLLLLVFCSRVSLKKIGVILLPACVAAFGLFVMGLYYARGGSTQTMDVRLVRGNTDYGKNAYVNNGDGTITDTATGLMWLQKDSGTAMTWQQALAYAEASTVDGYSDWRLPNAKELQSIVDYTRSPDTPARRPSTRCSRPPISAAPARRNMAFTGLAPAMWKAAPVTTRYTWPLAVRWAGCSKKMAATP